MFCYFHELKKYIQSVIIIKNKPFTLIHLYIVHIIIFFFVVVIIEQCFYCLVHNYTTYATSQIYESKSSVACYHN